MKISLSRILVVEGKEDASYLSNYLDIAREGLVREPGEVVCAHEGVG